MSHRKLFDDDMKPTDEQARERAIDCDDGHIAILVNGRKSPETMHYLHPNTDEPDTLCPNSRHKNTDVSKKPLEIYPDWWGEWCDRCLAHAWPELCNVNIDSELDNENPETRLGRTKI